MLQKFNKEFMAAVKKVMGQEQVPISIDEKVFRELLLELKCFGQEDLSGSASWEAQKAEELWSGLLKASQHPL